MQPTLSACCSARMHNERHVASALCIPVLLLTDDIDSELDEVFWCSGNCVKIPARELKTVESYMIKTTTFSLIRLFQSGHLLNTERPVYYGKFCLSCRKARLFSLSLAHLIQHWLKWALDIFLLSYQIDLHLTDKKLVICTLYIIICHDYVPIISTIIVLILVIIIVLY